MPQNPKIYPKRFIIYKYCWIFNGKLKKSARKILNFMVENFKNIGGKF